MSVVKFLKGETEVFEKKLRVLCCLELKQDKRVEKPSGGVSEYWMVWVFWVAFVYDLFRVEQNVAGAAKC